MLGDEELLKPPYSIENPAHRRAVLAELDRVKALGVKPPQNLWEYKVRTLQVLNKILKFANICPSVCHFACCNSVLLCLFNGFCCNAFCFLPTPVK